MNTIKARMGLSLAIVTIWAAITFSLTSQATGITSTKENYDFSERSNIPGKIIVDLNKKGQTITSAFYGSHLDSFAPYPSAKLVNELGIGRLRIGGNEYDVFNWKNSQAITKNGVFQIASLPEVATALKAFQLTGIYQINLHGYQPENAGQSYVLKNSFDALSAYEMIKQLNGVQKLNITQVSLGNEPEQWHETHSHTGAYSTESGISADEYIKRYIEFAIAVRTAQLEVNGDPNSIKIWGPEISSSWLDWNTGNFEKDCKWSDTIPGQVNCKYGDGKHTHFIPYFLEQIAKAEKSPFLNPRGFKLLDYFAFHYYPNFRTKISDINSYIKDPEGRQWVSKILEATRILHDPNYTNTIDKSSYRNFNPNIIGRMKNWLSTYYPQAKLTINEFAVDSDYRSTGYHPIVRPIYVADSVAIAAKEGVTFFNNFVLSSKPGSNIPWTLIDGGTQPTPGFYTYSLFTKHFLGTYLQTDDNFGDLVNSYSVETEKTVNLVLINKSPADKKAQIYLKQSATKKMATYLVPGWSTCVLKIEKSTGVFSRTFDVHCFGAKEMGVAKDLNYAKY